MRVTTWLLVLLLAIGQPIGLSAADYFGQVTFNGVPVPGVTVTASKGTSKAIATTNEDGIYHLADLVDGLWNVTIEMLGFATVQHEITIPDEKEGPPATLTVRPFADLASVSSQSGSFQRTSLTRSDSAPADVTTDARDRPPVDLTVLIGPTGIGAEDGLLITGSLNNGASTPFALPRGIGNNRPRPPSVFSYAAGLRLGNSAWDARPASLTGLRLQQPSYIDTQADGTFQGQIRVPWLRNALTLNLAYQGSSSTTANTQSSRVPTDLERTGDFSQTLDVGGQPVLVVDPATGQPFANNAIPIDRLSPQAVALLSYYPPADPDASGRFNYHRPIIGTTQQNAVRARIGYTINPNDRLEGGVSYQRGSLDSTSLLGFADSRNSSSLDAQAVWFKRPSRNVTVNARYQYTRARSESVPYFANRENVSGNAGITGNDQNPPNWGPPSLTFASDLAALTDGVYSSSRTQTHLWGADISKFGGPHNVTFGGEFRMQRSDIFAQQDPRGSFAFTGAATSVDFADFLLGLPQTSAIAFGNPDKFFSGRTYAAYISDDWRVSSRLTLIFGLRWEYESPISEANGRLVSLDVAPGFSDVSPVLAGDVGTLTGQRYSESLVHPDRSGFLPRVGLALRPRVASSLVIRAGYGLYRNTNVYQSIASLLAVQPPFSTTFNIATDPSNPLTLANGFVPVAGNTLNTFAIDPNFRVSSAHNWNASVQYDLPAGVTVTASYLGVRGINLMQQSLPNTFPTGADNPCPTCPVGFRYLTSGGRSVRHAGQVQLRRRLSSGFTAQVEYTLAKAMDNAAAFGGATLDAGALLQNWLDPEAEYARSNFDQRHLMQASFEYTTGVGTTGGTLLDGWKGRLVKDWTFTANLSTGSGLPLTPIYFAPVEGTGVIGSLRPNLTGVSNDAPDGAYANTASFAAPPAGQWGNAGRNSITGPRTFSLNAAVARTFRIGNRLNFDWRFDATNVLNRVTYASVNTLITSRQFGLPNRVNDMRRLRTSIRVRF